MASPDRANAAKDDEATRQETQDQVQNETLGTLHTNDLNQAEDTTESTFSIETIQEVIDYLEASHCIITSDPVEVNLMASHLSEASDREERWEGSIEGSWAGMEKSRAFPRCRDFTVARTDFHLHNLPRFLQLGSLLEDELLDHTKSKVEDESVTATTVHLDELLEDMRACWQSTIRIVTNDPRMVNQHRERLIALGLIDAGDQETEVG